MRHVASTRGASAGADSAGIVRRGDIRSTTLPGLFHEFSESGASGFLHVTDGDVRKSIEFGDGRVLFASSNQRDDRFSQYLLKSGGISLKNLMRALEAMMATQDRLGEVLVRFKLLSSEDVEKWIRTQVREVVHSVFQWTRGQFVIESRGPSRESIVIGAPADLMILEGIKRIESWARVYEEVGGLNTEYRTTRSTEKLTRELPLSPAEKEILRMCDAPTSLEEICEASSLDDLDACRSIWAFLALGALMKS